MNAQPSNLNARSATWYRCFSRRAAWAVVGFAALALLGWVLRVRELASVLPDQTTLKANTAVGLLVVGAGLLLVASDVPRRRRTGRLLGMLAVAIGVVHLAEWTSGADLGIDQLLASDFDAATHPGRMAPNSAFALTLAGSWPLVPTAGRCAPWPSTVRAVP